MRTTQMTRLLLSGVATLALAAPAMALDAQAFVDRIAEVYKPLGYDFAFGAAALNGDTVTVDGGTVTIVSSPDAAMEPMTFDTEVTFSGVTEHADGSYTADSVTIPDIEAEFSSEHDAELRFSGIRVDGFYLPAGNPVPATGLLQLVESFSTGPLSITRDGEEVFAFESMVSASTFSPAFATTDLTDLATTFSINGIVADLTSVSEEDPETGATIEALGLTGLAGDVHMDMTWALADGRMAVNEFSFDFADVAALDINLEVTGFTPDVLDQIYAMQAAMSAGGEPTEEQAQAQMMQGMALMQGVSIVSASVRYDDASLAGKLLDFFAAQSGADRASFVQGLKAMLPSMLAGSGIPALNDLVVPPVSAFLDNPQSIEVKVAPPSPTSLLVLMAAAANPAGLITALGLAVEANQPAE